MRVIDGMHRLMAASLQARETIEVMFFDGSAADIFLCAVQENVTHGLPLSQADRRAAAERIITSHPHMSDRAIGQAAGLAAKTIAAIRKRSNRPTSRSRTRGSAGTAGSGRWIAGRPPTGRGAADQPSRKHHCGTWPGPLAYPRRRCSTCATGWRAGNPPRPRSQAPRGTTRPPGGTRTGRWQRAATVPPSGPVPVPAARPRPGVRPDPGAGAGSGRRRGEAAPRPVAAQQRPGQGDAATAAHPMRSARTSFRTWPRRCPRTA